MFKERYGSVSRPSTTQVQLSDSLILIGGLWRKTGVLALNTATGLDTGVITAGSVYYLYVVIASGVLSLRASLSAQLPAGGLPYKKVGAFYADASGVSGVSSFGQAPELNDFAGILNQGNTAITTLSRGNLTSNVANITFVSGRLRFTALKKINFVGAGSYGTASTAPVSSSTFWFLNTTMMGNSYTFTASGGSQNTTSSSAVNAALNPGEYAEWLGAIYSGGTFATHLVSALMTEFALDWKDY